MKYKFTDDWFSHNIPTWEIALAGLKDKPIQALEIGSYEGRATTWLLDNILTHPGAHIVCVDTWKGSAEHGDKDMSAVKERFDANMDKHDNLKVSVYVGKSTQFFSHNNYRVFDLIYIDGSHTAADVLIDAVLAHQILTSGGIIIFDDYLWGDGLVKNPGKPKAAIDAFMECFANEYEVIALGYQVILRKR